MQIVLHNYVRHEFLWVVFCKKGEQKRGQGAPIKAGGV